VEILLEERISVRKRTRKKFDLERCYLKKLDEVEVKEKVPGRNL
jgi:hypothetical protein